MAVSQASSRAATSCHLFRPAPNFRSESEGVLEETEKHASELPDYLRLASEMRKRFPAPVAFTWLEPKEGNYADTCTDERG